MLKLLQQIITQNTTLVSHSKHKHPHKISKYHRLSQLVGNSFEMYRYIIKLKKLFHLTSKLNFSC